MPEFAITDLREGYFELVHWVRNTGHKVSPRGKATSEIQGALVEVIDPYDTLPVGVGRGISTGIAAVESCQLLAGETRPALVVDIGPNFENFREDNGEFHGAYGPRTKGQFDIMIRRLKADPDSRQAVTTIWDKKFDLMEDKRDYPCTLTFTFHIRNKRLNMRTHMRSNDVMKGVGYDYFQFSRVQIAMAGVLGIPVGRYFHYADSLHLYDSDLEQVEQLHIPNNPEYHLPPAILGDTWTDVARQASECLQQAEFPDTFLELSRDQWWYADAMRDARWRTAKRKKEAETSV